MCDRANKAHCSVNDIAEKIIQTADQNEIHCEDDACMLAYGVLRDCGYHIKKIMAEDNFRHYDC